MHMDFHKYFDLNQINLLQYINNSIYEYIFKFVKKIAHIMHITYISEPIISHKLRKSFIITK